MSETEFDFIVVGAGSAGGVATHQLSENSSNTVAVLEAGAPSHWLSPIPLGIARLIDHPTANWRFRAKSEESLNNRTIPVPRGRLLGGSSAINGMVYVRGQPLDYDTWAQLGNRGWSFDDVLPVFKSLESYQGGTVETRGRAGLLRVTECDDSNPLYDALLQAGEEIGLAPNDDYNGADQEGVVKTQTTIAGGRRMGVAHCFIKPASERANVKVFTNTHALRLIFEGKRCVGVEVRQDGVNKTLRAKREVLLSAGAIQSPQLLEVSGVGQPQRLADLGVELVHAAPGVGEGLRDHLSPRLGWSITQPGVAFNDRMRGLGGVREVLRYFVSKRGFLSLPAAPVLAFMRSREGLAGPDVQMHFLPYTYTSKGWLHKTPGMNALIYQLRPESLGSVHATSRDSNEAPDIRFNFLSAEIDRRTTVDSVRMTRRLIEASALDGIRGVEFKPGKSVQTDDEILDWVRRTAETAYHPVGTCKMGQDPNAVVDEQLRVRGVEGLRVADASIMPTMVSGNTNAACIMIGARAAAFMQAA